MPKTCKVLPSWRNFAKSGHTDHKSLTEAALGKVGLLCSLYSNGLAYLTVSRGDNTAINLAKSDNPCLLLRWTAKVLMLV